VTGSNKPHSVSRVDARAIAKTFAAAMRDEQPVTLTGPELALHRETRSIPAQPVPVFAWIRYGAQAVLVGALMVEWTDAACQLRWLTPSGMEHTAWVWRGAVRVRKPEEDPGPLASRADRGTALNEAASRAI
jgi:hypothetical protein